MTKQLFKTFIYIYMIAIFYLAYTTPITPHEAKILYDSLDIVSWFMRWGDDFIGGFIGLRLFSIIFGSFSVYLFYKLSQIYFEDRKEIYISTTIFMLLPGIITAIAMANEAIIVLPIVLLFVIFHHQKDDKYLPFLMLVLFFVHNSSFVFFVAVFLYGVFNKETRLSLLALTFLLAFIYLADGINLRGVPSGHFIDIFGLYAMVFSPLLFLYFFYAMYRILLREKKGLIWYISFTALLFSLILSIRQKIHITDFAPYVMIAVVLIMGVFNHTLRVRLPQFQTNYKRGFLLVISVLLISLFVTVGHQLFFLLDNSKLHFAKRIYRPYVLAKEVKSRGLECYNVIDRREEYQLRYYGVLPCRGNEL